LNWFLWILLAFLLGIVSWFVYIKYGRTVEDVIGVEGAPRKKRFDFKRKAKGMIKKAEGLFEKGEEKEAYSMVASALRLYLIWKNGLKKEMSSDEVLDFLKCEKLSYREEAKCFDLCSLVSFAKYKTNKKDFGKILKIVWKVVG